MDIGIVRVITVAGDAHPIRRYTGLIILKRTSGWVDREIEGRRRDKRLRTQSSGRVQMRSHVTRPLYG